MSETAIVLVTVLICCAATTLAVMMALRWRRVRRNLERVRWLRNETERAIAQLESASREEVLAGLQTIAFVNDAVVREKARNRIVALTIANDSQVAQQAKSTLVRITGGGAG